MTSSATNTSPSPPSIMPKVLTLSFRHSISMKIPTAASGSRNAANSNALRAAICAVIVVPMFAPMITAVAMVSDITPALTKPTVITVVADDDCMMVVVTRPIPSPANLLVPEVFPNHPLSLSLASFSIDSERTLKPYSSTPSPPSRPITATTNSIGVGPLRTSAAVTTCITMLVSLFSFDCDSLLPVRRDAAVRRRKRLFIIVPYFRAKSNGFFVSDEN